MDEDKNIKKDDEINIKEIFLILMKRKWWFIGSMLIVLAIGLLYVFLKPTNNLLTYQVELKEDYTNADLFLLYPNYEKELNYLLPETVPVIFKSEYGFESLDAISTEGIDYNALRKSESVKIALIANTSIFNISVSNPDYGLADKIAKTIIIAFENSIRDKEETILTKIVGKIGQDIKKIESKNDYDNTEITVLEDRLDSLYTELKRYIVDYNISLSGELEKNKKTENFSFYNIIIPPNALSSEISTLQEEMILYNQKIIENKDKIIDLNNLRENLLNDETVILNRIDLVSENPIYTTPNSRLKDLVIVIVLSLFAGAAVVFIVNFAFNLKKEKLPNK